MRCDSGWLHRIGLGEERPRVLVGIEESKEVMLQIQVSTGDASDSISAMWWLDSKELFEGPL